MVEVKVYNFAKDKVDEILEGQSILDGGNGRYSESSLVDLFNNAEIPNYISFDGNGIDLLDENKEFYDGSQYVGFISLYVSNENKEFLRAVNAPSFSLFQQKFFIQLPTIIS